jgi:protein-disulfide isomerase
MTQEVKMLFGFGLVTVFVLAGGIFLLTKSQPVVDTSAAVTGDTKKLLIRDSSHKTTNEVKKVQIVEFADFQCPACGVAFPVIENIRKTYGDKITYVYRNFPLMQHPQGKPAAAAAEAAGKQGKFWEMYTLLFSKQNEWSGKSNADEIFRGYAKILNLDIDKFTKDSLSEEVTNRIAQDISDGTSLGVNQTPTIFINGEINPGIPDETTLKTKIDKLLKK